MKYYRISLFFLITSKSFLFTSLHTQVLSAHLSIKSELVESLAAAVDGFWEPVSESLICKRLGSSITHSHNAISVRLGYGPVLTEPTGLQNNNKSINNKSALFTALQKIMTLMFIIP